MAIRKLKIEFEIGEIISISRKGEYAVAGECVEANGKDCADCVLNQFDSLCKRCVCSDIFRHDGKSIIIKPICNDNKR